MQMSARGNRRCCPHAPPLRGSLPPAGANFSWGGPAKNCCPYAPPLRRAVSFAGFTLLELLLVVAIIAVASTGVSFALRDSAQTQLEREAVRLAALLESARSRSMASGSPVRWRTTESGFVFDGLPTGSLPEGWLSGDVSAAIPARLMLGPEPVIGPQVVRLISNSQPGRSLSVETDGVRPFSVRSGDASGVVGKP